MNKTTFKNIAHAVKEWAIRFFSAYFFIYVALITLLILSGEKYIGAIIICSIIHCLNFFLKVKLDRKNYFVNIGIKHGVCVIVFMFTYLILIMMGHNNVFYAVAFLLSVIALFEFYETNLSFIEWINLLITSKKEIKVTVEQPLKKIILSKLVAADKEWNNNFDEDEISRMLFEFVNISNDNQMGHVVIRSMTSTDENNVEKIYVKAKEGYHIIIRGALEHICVKCSDVFLDGKLTETNDEVINKFREKLDSIDCAQKIVCAFKEIKDINAEEDNDFILVGCGIYEYEVEEKPVEKKKEIKVPEGYRATVVNIYYSLILTILLTANIFASLFDAVVFNSIELLLIAMLCFVFTTVISYCGDLMPLKKHSKYIDFVISSIGVCVSYFIGRYVMLNSDFSKDLFYVVTANVMVIVTLIGYITLNTLTSVKYYTGKTKKFSVIIYLITVLYMFMPWCGKSMQGYNISCIFISVAVLISVVCVAVNKIINFILRNKE